VEWSDLRVNASTTKIRLYNRLAFCKEVDVLVAQLYGDGVEMTKSVMMGLEYSMKDLKAKILELKETTETGDEVHRNTNLEAESTQTEDEEH
jgi:hypothetical protein